MGSIKFHMSNDEKRIFGCQICEGTYVDADGVVVSITINLDRHDNIFELDIWKVDNTALQNFPRPDEVMLVKR
jgi:hypothetical protein